MRIPSSSPARIVRAVLTASFLIVAAGCGGGSAGTNPIPYPGSNQLCDANSSGEALDRPSPGQTGVSTGTNTIEIVSNGNSDQLYQSYSQFDLILVGSRGDQLVTGPLSLSGADTTGNHPFPSDYYYTGTIQGTLQFGESYTVELNAPSTNCTPGVVGTFYT
ncbi:MAG TPA: hypothetical protein VHT53_12990 [Candidatus Elarobacter sp.]|nr:hypothetical protein [Candidatus Elarobacter sp.]